MGTSTAIAWTDHTFNPWWGCAKISEACDHCYAEAFAKRTGHAVWGKDGDRRTFGEAHWNEPVRWDRKAREAGRQDLVFCASMADVFEPHPAIAGERERLFRLIEFTPNLTWQLLTKRPEQINRLVPTHWLDEFPRNVWVGTTVEHQAAAELRIARLLNIEGNPTVRFLSCEPLLGSLYLRPEWMCSPRVDWVICGGESGPGHRPLDIVHARRLRNQCEEYAVPFFFKQVGGRTPTAGGDLLDGMQYKDFPQ